jgi:D-erythro-7,8-dihydroneopterin triphosphate epimerase
MSEIKPISPINQKTDYSIDLAVISLTNLRLRTLIGFNPEELEKRQDVVINGEIKYDAKKSYSSDNEIDALDYKKITKEIISHVESNSFRLLEKLTGDLIDISMRNNLVRECSFTVDKPNALRFADSVSITLTGKK